MLSDLMKVVGSYEGSGLLAIYCGVGFLKGLESKFIANCYGRGFTLSVIAVSASWWGPAAQAPPGELPSETVKRGGALSCVSSLGVLKTPAVRTINETTHK